MKKNIQHILIVFFGANGILWLINPMKSFCSVFMESDINLSLTLGILLRVLLIIFVLFYINKLSLKRFDGLTSKTKLKNLKALVIPLVIILMGIYSNYEVYVNTDRITLLLFSVSVLTIGFAEEFVFRGFIFPVLLRTFWKFRGAVYLSVFISSLMFGLVHYVHLFSQPSNFSGITSQVIFAVSIGVFLSGIMLRTSSIIIPSLLHALINFSFGVGKIKPEVANQIVETVKGSLDWNMIIPTTIILAFIFFSGVFMIRKCDVNEIVGKLEG